MLQYKDLGIILKSQDFFETDKIITILTKKKGKIRAIAKGVRRLTAKLAGSLEPFSLTNLVLVEGKKDLDIICGAEIVSSFKDLRQSLKKTAAAFFLCELVDKLTGEKEPHANIFEKLKKALGKLNSKKSLDLELVTDYMMINVLADLGYRPEIKKCQNCGGKITAVGGKNFFSPKLGGVLCPKCSSKGNQALSVSIETLKILKLFLEYDINIIDRISPKDTAELSKILERFLEYISEKKINSSKFYKLVNHKKD